MKNQMFLSKYSGKTRERKPHGVENPGLFPKKAFARPDQREKKNSLGLP